MTRIGGAVPGTMVFSKELEDSYQKTLSQRNKVECLVNKRKIWSKIVGVMIWPCSFYLACLSGCKPCEGRYRDSDSLIPYADGTRCSCGSCWNSRLPPKNSTELLYSCFDPFICCCCCADESLEQYLIPEERDHLKEVNQELESLNHKLLDRLLIADIGNIVRSYLPSQNRKREINPSFQDGEIRLMQPFFKPFIRKQFMEFFSAMPHNTTANIF